MVVNNLCVAALIKSNYLVELANLRMAVLRCEILNAVPDRGEAFQFSFGKRPYEEQGCLVEEQVLIGVAQFDCHEFVADNLLVLPQIHLGVYPHQIDPPACVLVLNQEVAVFALPYFEYILADPRDRLSR